MDRLTEYDYVIQHRPSNANVMQLADGMSRMPGRYRQTAVAEDSERMAMCVPLATSLPALPGKSHQRYRETQWYGNTCKDLKRDFEKGICTYKNKVELCL